MVTVYSQQHCYPPTRLKCVQSADGDSILPATLLPTYQTTRLRKNYKTNRQCQENFKCHIISQLVGQPFRWSACCNTDRQTRVHVWVLNRFKHSVLKWYVLISQWALSIFFLVDDTPFCLKYSDKIKWYFFETWHSWGRASWYSYEINQQDSTIQVNLLFLVGCTCFGRCFLPSSGALDCIYSIW